MSFGHVLPLCPLLAVGVLGFTVSHPFWLFGFEGRHPGELGLFVQQVLSLIPMWLSVSARSLCSFGWPATYPVD